MSNASSRVTRCAVPAAVAVVASMVVPALSPPVFAATPKARTTYEGTVKGPSVPVEITFKLGSSTKIMKKVVIKSDCGDALPSDKLILKNVEVEDNGKFNDYIYDPGGDSFYLQGRFVTKNKVEGTAEAGICFSSSIEGDFTAKG